MSRKEKLWAKVNPVILANIAAMRPRVCPVCKGRFSEKAFRNPASPELRLKTCQTCRDSGRTKEYTIQKRAKALAARRVITSFDCPFEADALYSPAGLPCLHAQMCPLI